MRGRTAWFFAMATAIAVTALLASDLADAYELPLRDALLRALPRRAPQSTTVVAIDEPSLQGIGPWPWPREKLAALVDRIAAGGARAVVLDVLLSEERPGDETLARSLRQVPSAAVCVLDDRGAWLLPAKSIGVAPAHGMFEVDHDGIARRLASTKQNERQSFPALSIAAVSLFSGKPIPVARSIVPAFRTPAHAIPVISAATVLLRGAGDVRGRIVFVGSTAAAIGDRFLTPTSESHRNDPGVMVHAAATESLLRGEAIHSIAPVASGVIAGIIVAILLPGRRRVAAAMIGIAIVAAGVLLLQTNVAIPLFTLFAVAALAHAAMETLTTAKTLRETRAHAARLRTDREQEVEAKRRLAHELKTPLASMRGLTQLLAQFDLSEEERHRVTTLLETEAGKLQSLVQGMLDLERVPLRDFDSVSSVIDLGDLVSRRVEFLRASTDRRLSVDAAHNVFVRADATLLERVVDNLVGNALKYTSDEVAVRVACRDGGAAIEVEDRGPAIAAQDRDRIFERFVRGASAAGTHGLGLGLSLVAEIARWHHGNVTLEDAAGGGSLFRVTLPVAESMRKAGAV